jgi:hypothetical protein
MTPGSVGARISVPGFAGARINRQLRWRRPDDGAKATSNLSHQPVATTADMSTGHRTGSNQRVGGAVPVTCIFCSVDASHELADRPVCTRCLELVLFMAEALCICGDPTAHVLSLSTEGPDS